MGARLILLLLTTALLIFGGLMFFINNKSTEDNVQTSLAEPVQTSVSSDSKSHSATTTPTPTVAKTVDPTNAQPTDTFNVSVKPSSLAKDERQEVLQQLELFIDETHLIERMQSGTLSDREKKRAQDLLEFLSALRAEEERDRIDGN